MAEVLAKFGTTSTMERDVDKNHCSPIAPPTEATPTAPMNQTRSQAIYDRLVCFFFSSRMLMLFSKIPLLVAQKQFQPNARLSSQANPQ
jgi:hypothetical protein